MAKTLISLNRQGVVDGDLNAAGFRVTNLGAATANGDAAIRQLEYCFTVSNFC